MNSRFKKFLAVLAISIATAQPLMAEDQLPADRQGGDMVFWDMILARPIGLLGIIGGSVVFVVALPFTIPSGSVDTAANELVKKPINYTFKRPLGQVGQKSGSAPANQPPRPDSSGFQASIASAAPIRAMPVASIGAGRSPSCSHAASTPITGVASVPSPARPAGILLRA
jgi:hypothetical protein